MLKICQNMFNNFFLALLYIDGSEEEHLYVFEIGIYSGNPVILLTLAHWLEFCPTLFKICKTYFGNVLHYPPCK